MTKGKSIKRKGKISFTRYFQDFNSGEPVVLVRDLSFKENFPSRMQGKTGVVAGKRGSAFVVNVRQGKMTKQYLVNAINLKKLSIVKENKNDIV